MKKLKIKLWRIENVVMMKVLEQDESLRGQGEIFNNNGTRIASEGNTALFNDAICINGRRIQEDGRICSKDFETIEEAQAYYNKVKKVVQDYNKTLVDEGETLMIDDVESEVVE